jgi:3',5'-cyclic AMP phosphodiesterase CpdA
MNRGASSATTALLVATLGAARLLGATGVVFDDRNGDGVRDPGEPGLAAVQVSNGVDIATTDAKGAYHLPDRPGALLFVIKPRGWKPLIDGDNLPRFHAPRGAVSADFPLRRSNEGDALRILVITDPQPGSLKEVGYLAHGIIDRIGRRTDVSFGVTLGDVVYDRFDLFGSVNDAVARVGIPWYNLPGNHDVLGTPDEAASLAPFEAVYGPSTYAFHAGPALFVALADVRPLGGPRYVGGLRADQFEFLGNLLRDTPPAEWVVLMLHIPLFPPELPGTEPFRTADRQRLFGLLTGHAHVLILSGHTHYQRHATYGAAGGWSGTEPIREYNVAAACGGFWGGPLDGYGIPVSTMWDGTPPGYAVLNFTPDAVSTDYIPARMPADHQIALHGPDAVATKQGFVSFYANVFNGDDTWTVFGRVDGRAWNPLRRVLGWDPSYAADFLAQDTDAHPSGRTRLPDPVVCYHLWRGALPADLSPGRHVLGVQATDPQGHVFFAERPLDVVAP